MVAAIATVLSMVGLYGVAGIGAEKAEAANADLFQPGNIISDAIFFDGYALTSSQIQSFLKSKVPTCNSSYACLTTYTQDTPTMPASSYCARYVGEDNESAARIISKVGRACGINQKALLVLLEKEQSLVTSSTPSSTRFQKATGMGCPDTAPCNSAFGGFFYQVYYAARVYKVYAANPDGYNYKKGRSNNIQYHPNKACGTKSVYIENQATAGLYIYTPYTPDAAALSNMYGVGGSCSSYGNRNFWRIFSDWFGSPSTGSSLVRTSSNGTVYLLAGESKYSIPTSSLYNAFGTLGPVGVVSQQLIDAYEDLGRASLIVRSPTGGIYLVDGGLLRPMSSCAVVEHYGGSCSSGGYMQLSSFQISQFDIGSTVQTYLTSSSTGTRFVIRDGYKREVLDEVSMAAEDISGNFATVKSATLQAISTGAPVIRDSVFVRTSGTSNYSLWADGALHSIGRLTGAAMGVPERSSGDLSLTALARLKSSPVRFDGVVRDDAGIKVVLPEGTLSWADDAVDPGQEPVRVSSEFVKSYPVSDDVVTVGGTVRGMRSSTVYLVTGESLRPVTSTEALKSINPGAAVPTPIMLPDVLARYTERGGPLRIVGEQVKVSGSRSVWVIDGLNRKVQVPTLTLTKEAGIFGYTTYSSSASLSGYPTSSMLTWGLVCGDVKMIPVGGELRPIPAGLVGHYSIKFTTLADSTCATLTVGDKATAFIRVDRSIFQIVDGEKRQIMSMSRYRELSGDSTYMNVSTKFANSIPTGPVA